MGPLHGLKIVEFAGLGPGANGGIGMQAVARSNGWISALAPAGTPDAIVQRLHQEIARAVASEEVRQVYRTAAIEPATMSPREYRDMLVRETAKYERIVRDARIEKQ